MRQMLRYDLAWYEAHFEPEDGGELRPVRGEISPLYARLRTWQVNRIADLLPDLRIILTLRHPRRSCVVPSTPRIWIPGR
jgi:hypothetical protein